MNKLLPTSLILLAMATTFATAADTPSNAQVARWIEQLNANQFAVRELATQNLIEAGRVAIEPIGDVVADGDLESATRGLHVLLQLALSDDEVTEDAARAMLETIAGDAESAARGRAKQTLAVANSQRQDKAIEALRKLGAAVDPVQRNVFLGGVWSAETRYSIAIDEDWTGGRAGLKYIRWLPELYMITLSGEQVTDDWLKPLAGLDSLQFVEINRTQIRGPGLEPLTDLPVLQRLTIKYSPVGNDSLDLLKKLKTPSMLSLYGTKLTPDAAEDLATALANVEIDYRRGAFLGVGCTQTEEGCLISQVHPNSAAEKAGLRVHDIVVSYNGVKVDDFTKLTEVISEQAAGETAVIKVRRGTETLEFKPLLGEWE